MDLQVVGSGSTAPTLPQHEDSSRAGSSTRAPRPRRMLPAVLRMALAAPGARRLGHHDAVSPDDLLDLVHGRVRSAVPRDRPCLVGVDGADGAGKSTFADRLARSLAASGLEAEHVSVDGFHRSRLERYARGRRSPEGFWLDSYDYEALHRELLVPWRRGTGLYRTAVRDVSADAAVLVPARRVPPRGVLVVDGIFLLRDELVDVWDLTVRLEVPPVERFRRMSGRDGSPADPSHPDNRRYLLGQRLYEDACDPAGRADVVVEMGDWDCPVLLRGHP